jgi:Response regulator containing CheY-like receiver domain and AraC-type DNA-binding domain
MMRAMIVEDEPAHRVGLMRHVRWSELGYEAPEQAADAEEALARMKTEPVDVLLVDIQMPGMDGLELVRTLRGSYPDVFVLIISAYDEFEYARRAVEIGANAYLLKPVKIEEVERWLTTFHEEHVLARKIAEEEALLKKKWQGSLELAREKFLEELLERGTGLAPMTDKECQRFTELLDLPYDEFCAHWLLFATEDAAATPAQPATGQPATMQTVPQVLETVKTVLSGDGIVVSAKSQPNMAAALFVTPGGGGPGVRTLLEHRLAAVLEALAAVGVPVDSVCVSETADEWKRIPKLYQDALLALEKAGSPESKIVWADDVPVDDLRGPGDLEQLQARMHEKIAAADLDGYMKLLASFFNRIAGGISFRQTLAFCFGLVEKLMRTAELQGVRIGDESAYIWRTLIDCANPADLRSAVFRVSERITEAITRAQCSRKHQVIERAVEYLHDHLHENITVKEMAHAVHLNATYLSVLFKKEMGVTISDYLQQIRIERAKELLRDHDAKVYEVAERVGYQTSSYFTQQFKKWVGCTPAEFRKRRL